MAGSLIRLRTLGAVTAVAVVVLSGARGGTAVAGADPPGEGIDLVYVAAGANFPDSLGAAPGAALQGAPIIIVPTNPPIPSSTATELTRLDPKQVLIVGGFAAVSAPMGTAIAVLLPNASVERVSGSDRYQTNALLSQATFPVEGWVSVSAPAFVTPEPEIHDAHVEVDKVWNVTTGVLLATISLPHGAEILELRVSGFDSDAGQSLTAVLWRRENPGVTSNIVSASSSSAGAQPGIFTVSSTAIIDGTESVDNANYGYSIAISGADGNPELWNVMVRYRLGTP